jgi:hypothetical protein
VVAIEAERTQAAPTNSRPRTIRGAARRRTGTFTWRPRLDSGAFRPKRDVMTVAPFAVCSGFSYRLFAVETLRSGTIALRHQLIDAHRKRAVAAKPSPVRTACNRPHRSINARLFGPASVGSVAVSLRLVGMIPKNV